MTGGGAPKPANFDAMWQSWDDPIQFGVERAIYQSQLAEEGVAMPRHTERGPERRAEP